MIEEKVTEGQEEKMIVPVELDESTMGLIERLQEENKALKSKDETALLEKLVNLLGNRAAPTAEPKTGQFNFNKMYGMDDIDPNDVLPQAEWVTFITHRVMHIICDDKRAGKNVPAPFDIIVFKYESTREIKGGRETELIQLSTYTCKSRIERDWLKSHSKFKVDFFDKIKGTEYSANFEKSKALGKKMRALQGMGQHELISMARANGLNPGDMDLENIRAAVAMDAVDKQFANKANHNHTSATMAEQHLEATKMGSSIAGG